MDLSKLSPAELNQLNQQIDKELKRRHRQNIKKARSRLRAIADSYGVSVGDLLHAPATVRQGAGTDTVTAGSGHWTHPDDPRKIWRGRGRKPNWLKQWEANGRSVSELRVA